MNASNNTTNKEKELKSTMKSKRTVSFLLAAIMLSSTFSPIVPTIVDARGPGETVNEEAEVNINNPRLKNTMKYALNNNKLTINNIKIIENLFYDGSNYLSDYKEEIQPREESGYKNIERGKEGNKHWFGMTISDKIDLIYDYKNNLKAELRDIKGLEKAENLKNIAFFNTSIEDYTPLTQLKNLENIDFYMARGFNDLTPLNKLQSGKKLRLISAIEIEPEKDKNGRPINLYKLNLKDIEGKEHFINPDELKGKKDFSDSYYGETY